MAGTRHHTGSADVLLILLIGSPIAGALIGGGIGLVLSGISATVAALGYPRLHRLGCVVVE